MKVNGHVRCLEQTYLTINMRIVYKVLSVISLGGGVARSTHIVVVGMKACLTTP